MEKHEGVIDLTVWALGGDGKFRRNCLCTVISAWVSVSSLERVPAWNMIFLSLALGLELSVPVVRTGTSKDRKPVRTGKAIHAARNDP